MGNEKYHTDWEIPEQGENPPTPPEGGDPMIIGSPGQTAEEEVQDPGDPYSVEWGVTAPSADSDADSDTEGKKVPPPPWFDGN